MDKRYMELRQNRPRREPQTNVEQQCKFLYTAPIDNAILLMDKRNSFTEFNNAIIQYHKIRNTHLKTINNCVCDGHGCIECFMELIDFVWWHITMLKLMQQQNHIHDTICFLDKIFYDTDYLGVTYVQNYLVQNLCNLCNTLSNALNCSKPGCPDCKQSRIMLEKLQDKTLEYMQGGN